MKTVWIYVDTNHHVGHPDHLKVSATPEVADEWFKENDPETRAASRRFHSIPSISTQTVFSAPSTKMNSSNSSKPNTVKDTSMS